METRLHGRFTVEGKRGRNHADQSGQDDPNTLNGPPNIPSLSVATLYVTCVTAFQHHVGPGVATLIA